MQRPLLEVTEETMEELGGRRSGRFQGGREACARLHCLAKPAEVWRSLVRNAIVARTPLTFTRVPAKVPRIHQSSGEGVLGMWAVSGMSGMCPSGTQPKKSK